MAGSKTLTEVLNVRLTEVQLQRLKELAERDDRSVGAVVRRLIREHIEREDGERAA